MHTELFQQTLTIETNSALKGQLHLLSMLHCVKFCIMKLSKIDLVHNLANIYP